jgi:hypothetical protein
MRMAAGCSPVVLADALGNSFKSGEGDQLAFYAAGPGDANLDGRVGYLDYLRLKQCLRDKSGGPSEDFSHDGRVDREDFVTLRDQFGRRWAPPTVTAAVLDEGAGCEGAPTAVAITFSDAVSVWPDVARLYSNATGLLVTNLATGDFHYDAPACTASWDLSKLDLPDGRYTLYVSAWGVTDPAGNRLDGNGDGAGEDDFKLVFLVDCDGEGMPGSYASGSADLLDVLALPDLTPIGSAGLAAGAAAS